MLAVFLCLGPSLFLMTGCGGAAKPPEPVAVAGKLYLGEKPLAGVIVRFWAQQQNVANADALTQANGGFELKLPPGKYDVTLMAVPAAGQQPPEVGLAPAPGAKAGSPAKASFPARFLNRETTGWRGVEIPALGRNNLDLEIKN
jgi:hypothetical protein